MSFRRKEEMVSHKISRNNFHARSSVSLPSRLHPTVPEYNEILCRLKSSESASSSSSSIRKNIESLEDLHDRLVSLMLLPENQKAFGKECNGKLVDEVLDGSLRLLDLCRTAKDSLSMIKECTQELQSSLRRKGSDATEAGKYLVCRKAVKKLIQKALRNSKGLRTTNKEQDSLLIVSMLREVEQVTLSVLESLMAFVFGPKDQSLVSKLMNSKRTTTSEFEQIDAAMQSIFKHNAVGFTNIQTDVADLELSIEDLESGTECLYRHLIKSRVTLLNIVSS